MGRKIRHSKSLAGRGSRLFTKSERISVGRSAALESLEPRVVLNADPLISEFQADNSTTLRDGNGDFSDWIEIRNPDTQPMDISGYYLTDDNVDLRQWAFPQGTVLEPGEHRIVFASGDNQPDKDGYLHTSFKLAREGEYLALVKPDGISVVQSFDQYPEQFEDQSYGVAVDRDTSQFVATGSNVRTFVPTDDSLGLDWTQVGFDDASWTSGATGVGFEVPQLATSATDSFDGPLGPEWTTDLPDGSNGTVSIDNGDLVITVPTGEDMNYNNRGTAPIVRRDLPAADAVNYEIVTRVSKLPDDDGAAGIVIYDKASGAPAVHFEYTEDRYFRLFAGGQQQDERRDSGEDNFFLRLVRDGIEKTWSASYKVGEADDWRLVGTATDGENNTPTVTDLNVGLYARTPTSTMTARFASIDLILPDQPPVYGPDISMNVDAMRNANSSIYMRIPFTVADVPGRFDEMSMSVRYDDGFVAYLNGTRITEQNVPIDATWNSAASGTFGAVGGTIPRQEILLGSFIDTLLPGDNVLAIHGMNVSANDTDFFFDAEMLASEVLAESIQYFVNPTPGKANDLPAAPVPVIMGEDGIFFGEKSVELQVAGENLEIRYTLDGSDPRRDSTLYTGPFVLNESAMLQARSFDTSVDPAFNPSNATSGTYFALDESLRGRTSDLPIVILDSLGQSLPATSSTSLRAVNVIVIDVSKATGRATLEEGKIDYLGRGGVRDRGSSSSGLRKPNMAFETWGPAGTDLDDDENVEILGMAADSDWIFYAGTSYDPTLFHNQYAFDLSNQVGQWAPDYRHAEVFFNTRWSSNTNENLGVVASDDYYGVYAIHEKPTRGSHRIDVEAIDPSVTKTPEEAAPGEPNISGGYIWKIDRGDPGEPAFSAGGASLNWVYPKSPASTRARPDQKATIQQEDWVKDYLGQLRDALRDPDINDPEGYTKYIDLESWAEHHLLNVLTFNVDAYRLSGYIHKDRDSKIAYGPVWDFDRTLNSTDGRDANPFVWQSTVGDRGTDFFGTGVGQTGGTQWLRPLFREDPGFWQYYVDTWHELRLDEFSDKNLHDLVDKLAGEIRESQSREIADCVPCRGIRPRGGWENELVDLKEWLTDRSGFIDSNFAPVAYFKSGDEVLPRDTPGLKVSAGYQSEIVPIVRINTDTPIISGENGAVNASYMVPVNDDLGDSWTTADFDDAAWEQGKLGIGFGTSTGFEDNYTSTIRPSEINEDATNILVRVPFTVDSLDGLDELVLQMKYDDGFVAYLNGEKVVEANLRDLPVGWDTRANNHRNSEAIVFEDFNITEHIDKLKVGENVLAIRAINATTSSNDMLMLPALVKRKVSFEPAPTGKVYYTTDGTDPRGPDGNPSATAVELPRGEKITANSNLRVIARNFDDSDRGPESQIVLTDWSGPTTTDFVIDQPELVISEINYNPADPNAAEAEAGYGNDDFEFIEIYNPSNVAADLIGTKLSDGVNFDFYGVKAVEAGGYAVVVRNADAFQMRYGDNAAVVGVFDGTLNNAGEDIDLVDGTGNVIFSVNYGDNDPWPVRADGFGATLELADPANVVAAAQSKWYSWRGSSENGGSPGQAGDGPVGVVINEVIAHTEGPVNVTDSIELHNITAAPIDIGGWRLSDSSAELAKFSIPNGTVLPAGGYVVFDESDFNVLVPVAGNTNFALSGDAGDDLWLTKPDGTFVDDVEFRETLNGESLGRMPNGSGRLAPLTRTTFGADNGSPRVGPIVISEIQYNPKPSSLALAADPSLEASDLEYVQIHNPTGSEVDLTDWRLRGGADYDFAAGTKLAAGETITILKFNPDDPENINQVNAFKAHYAVADGTRLLGGYAGQLNNSDDRIELLRPDQPPADRPNATPRVTEDEVLYDDLAPWPTQADGTGRALKRVSMDAFGNAATSWTAGDLPESLQNELPGDFDGSGVVDAADINLLFGEMRSQMHDASFDLTGDGLVNEADRDELVITILGTNYGDSTLDGLFNSRDLVVIFQAGQYEDAIAGNSTWETGDWNGDGDFSTRDIVLAFQGGGYSPAVPNAASGNLQQVGAAIAEAPAVEDTAEAAADQLTTAGHVLNAAGKVELIDELVESLFDDDLRADSKSDAVADVTEALLDDGLSL